MAALKNTPRRDAKHDNAALARVMREWSQLVQTFEAALLRSLQDAPSPPPSPSSSTALSAARERVRSEARRLAFDELSAQFTRKQIGSSLRAAEDLCRRAEEQLLAVHDSGRPDADGNLASIHNGYFRLYSPELFDLLGQPTDLRFGTLRFHRHASSPAHAGPPHLQLADRDHHDHHDHQQPAWISVELALADAFFVADSLENLPFHAFRMPSAPSLQNRGILSRKLDDGGAFPAFDSWLLFTFLGDGCLKLQVPIEMCAEIYGGPLRGRENDDVLFWALFVEDDAQ